MIYGLPRFAMGMIGKNRGTHASGKVAHIGRPRLKSDRRSAIGIAKIKGLCREYASYRFWIPNIQSFLDRVSFALGTFLGRRIISLDMA
jgi:hypothetical protein